MRVGAPPAEGGDGSPAIYIDARPALYPKQRAAVFSPARYAVCEASTKSGKTTACMQWIVDQIARHGAPGRHFWWVAPWYKLAAVPYRRLTRTLPERLFPRNDGRMTVDFPNGARLWHLSGEKPDTLYAEDVYAVVMDEASRTREESWHAVRSTLTFTRGPARIIGNVKGRKNWAYKMARRAEAVMAAGGAGMHYARLTAHDAVEAGVLDAEEIADARETLPEAVFRELYLAEASDDANNPFGHEHIRACTREGLAPGPAVAFGWDLGRHEHFTCGVGLNARGAVCHLTHEQGRPWAQLRRHVVETVGRVPTAMDATHGSVGDPFVEEVQGDLLAKGLRNVEAFEFTGASKQQLIDGLVMGVQDHEVSFPEGVIAREMADFEYQYTRTGVLYRAPEGLTDDAVMALALAWRIARPLLRRAAAGAMKLGAPAVLQRPQPWQTG